MKERLTRKEAAEYLTEVLGTPVSFKTLQKYATVGGGPDTRSSGAELYIPKNGLGNGLNPR